MRVPKQLCATVPAAMLSGLVLFAAGSAAAQQSGQQSGNYSYSAGYDAALRQGQAQAAPAQDVLEQVYFDFDSAELRSDARTKLNDLASMVRENDIGQVNVVGHTDTAGPADYNMGLSQRRAEAVSQALTDLGIQNQIIDLSWEGEQDPAVPTGDGVPEQQNRRVAITIPAAGGFQAASAQ
ncbi:OmpA family protein [Indioceanicola profundi]|uniref:OmpA family protein n=1 Tax=Indioceanicola profundi TaxID=2220096 RepID=UPI001968A6D8|nr:OmpA family protein [Indioceanicola profundi]